ncbi:MAG: hypothetical protein WCT26_02285 [Candidatus Buchananbacteria bacterium]|jgi:hypothetical protein
MPPLDQQEPNLIPLEKIPTPETGLPNPETVAAPEYTQAEKAEPEKAPIPSYQPKASAQAPAYTPAADESVLRYKQIEKVLEEDLGEIYNNLTPQEQKAFKIKGEETARSIFQLVYHKTKVKIKKIVKLIKAWLKAVPGINKFFLEQEAKIKADKIAALVDE